MIKYYKKQQLHKNWGQYNFQHPGSEVTFAHYICNEANNNPGFFRWLFDNENLLDFESGDETEWKSYVKSVMINDDDKDYDVIRNI